MHKGEMDKNILGRGITMCKSIKVSESKDAGNSKWLSVLELKYNLKEEEEAGVKGSAELHTNRKSQSSGSQPS